MQAQLAATRTRIAENAAAQKEADATLATHPFDPQQGPVLDAELAQVIAAQRETDAGLARAAEHLKHAEEKIAEIKRDQAKVTGLEARIAAGTEEIELLKLTRSVIADYVVYLMQVVRSRIEGEVSRIISEITGGRYEQVLLDEDFNLLVRDVDNDYAIDRFSGGEQDDIAVALTDRPLAVPRRAPPGPREHASSSSTRSSGARTRSGGTTCSPPCARRSPGSRRSSSSPISRRCRASLRTRS